MRQLGIRTTMKHIREHREPRTITPPLKTEKEGVVVIFIKDRSEESSIYASSRLRFIIVKVTTTTMLKVMQARQESVAINNIKINSTLSAGSLCQSSI